MHRKHALRTAYLLILTLLCLEMGATAARGEVGRLFMERVLAKTYRLRWERPTVINDVLRSYHLSIQMLHFNGFKCPGFQAQQSLNFSYKASVTSAEVQNLTPSATYKISMQARTDKGGPWKDFHLSTEGEAPDGQPLGLQRDLLTERSARAFWQEPDCKLINGGITGYQTLRTSSARWAQAKVQKDVVRPVLYMDDLAPFTEYILLVRAKNRFGLGPAASITFTTTPSAPPPPSKVTVYSARSDQLAVTWLPPYPPHGVLEAYMVYYKLASEELFTKYLHLTPDKALCKDAERAGAHCALLSQLLPNKQYVVLVAAKNKGVDNVSNRSNSVTAVTRESITVIGTNVKLKTVEANAITLQLTRADNESKDIRAYFVLVERHDSRNRTKWSTDGAINSAVGSIHEWTGGTPSYNVSVAKNQAFYVAAKMAPDEVRRGRQFTVGDGLYYDGYYNAPLVPGTTYSVGLAAELRTLGRSKIFYRRLFDPITVRRKQPAIGWPVLTAIIIGVVIAAVVATVAVWMWRKKRRKDGERKEGQKRRKGIGEGEEKQKKLLGKHPPTMPDNDEKNDRSDSEIEETTGGGRETTSKPLPLSKLQGYVQRMLACDGLKSEFISQPKGCQRPAIEAKRTENKFKNRYGNLLAYDHSRVKLKPIPGVSQSDYINANYIDGFWRPARYIATQGPKHQTLNDFWRMVWQEYVCKIVMLTSLVELGKNKCEKYWPEKTASYGEIQVHLISEEKFPDCVIRKLHLTLADTTREVKHFHLTSWPDYGLPLYPNTLLTFLRKVNEYRTYNEAPVVVHCSAGVGRTGAYILLDNLLEQAQSEGVVDVVGQLSTMRKNRMNVVDRLEQYNFVHRCLVESVCLPDNSFPSIKMHDRYRQLLSVDKTTGKSNIAMEFEELEPLKPRFTPEDFAAAREPANMSKSRDPSVLAPDRGRAYLRDGTFLNAVYVNGFYKKDKFLVTQTPSSKDAGDLWKLVIETGAKTIVTLDVFSEGGDVVPFWPTSGSAKYGDHTVECAEDRHANIMSVQVLRVKPKHKMSGSSRRVTVRHFHLSTWNSAEQMVDLVGQVERWQQQSNDGIILVQCRNGCTASGLFCCCALVLEKLKNENEVDVFYATRIIRENRPQFISNCDQYKFCYDTAVAYMKCSKI
ncbi:receptor-type tyrosine-protein phosphatase mu-like isoform X1 [Amblyomma americanum]